MMYTNCFLFSCACGQQISTVSKITGYQNKQNFNTFNSNGEPQTDNSHAKQVHTPHPIQTIREIYGEREIWRYM